MMIRNKIIIGALISLLICPVFVQAQTGNLSANGPGGTNAGGGESIESDEFTGAATQSINIPVPPGRGGMEPNININYNSHRKNVNSWVGNGWELDMGSITRLPENGSIDFTHGRSFEARFSGQAEELKLVDRNVDVAPYMIQALQGMSVDLYQASVESSFNIYLHVQVFEVIFGGIRTRILDDYWIVFDRAGIRYEFGRNENARHGVNTSFWVHHNQFGAGYEKWLLNRVIDPNGNEMIVNYSESGLPDSIQYDDIQIDFRKTSVGHYFPQFRQQFTNRNNITKKLQRIIVFENQSRIQQYTFTYADSSHHGLLSLATIEQYGRDDGERLPAREYTYYDFSARNFALGGALTWRASRSDGQTPNEIRGFIDNKKNMIIDMNGDGLVDQMIARNDGAFDIYLNNGNHFNDEPVRWEDPFDGCRQFNARIGIRDCNGYITKDEWLFLMDVNGDALPDRIVSSIVNVERENRFQPPLYDAVFHIAFNTGQGWSDEIVTWRDPYRGAWGAGLQNKDYGFVDLNGDGLIDRVIKQHEGPDGARGMDVYWNNGAGFSSTPAFWADPCDLGGCGDVGMIYRAEGLKTKVVIRDFNGDGLPDRIWRLDSILSGGEDLGPGFAVILNKNGTGWAEVNAAACEGIDRCIELDGINTLSIPDPVEEQEQKGYFSSDKVDWIDMNNDGFLDRIEGDPDAGTIKIHFFQGIAQGSNHIELSEPVGFLANFNDGVPNRPDEWNGHGYITKYEGDKKHTFFQDMNGDGFPDRVSLTERNNERVDRSYKIHLLHMNAITFGDHPNFWVNPKVNQPTGALKTMSDGRGNSMEIEYLPSTRRLDEDRPTHRFLPMNLYLAHKLYSSDFTVSDQINIDNRARRGMREITYEYRGGNLYIRYAQRIPDPEPVDEEEDEDEDNEPRPVLLSQKYYSRFNGFHEVRVIQKPSASEDWQAYETRTIYHQGLGEVPAVPYDEVQIINAGRGDGNQEAFPHPSYGHFALSGRPYWQFVDEQLDDGRIANRVTQFYGWAINEAEGSGYQCIGSCFPRLGGIRKTIRDGGGALSSEIRYSYDLSNGNLTSEETYDGQGNLLLEKISEYYGRNEFDANLWIRDRISSQSQSDGNEILRHKTFTYDDKGNPTNETFHSDNSSLSTTRTFQDNGNLATVTDTDGITRIVGYGDEGFFPVTESMELGEGRLTKTRQFDRLTGQPKHEINYQQLEKSVERDDFGRPVREYITDAQGNPYLVKKYKYEYILYNVETNSRVKLLRTTVWAPQPGYESVEEGDETQIIYTDAGGYVLQSCERSERGDFRLTQFRIENGGKKEVRSEPAFDENCSFKRSIANNVRKYETLNDFFSRTTHIDPPSGDQASPIGETDFSYEANEAGHLVKTTTLPGNKTKIEEFDESDRLISVTDPNGNRLEYNFNAVGDLSEVLSNGHIQTTIRYDKFGRKTSITDNDMGTWRYEYDEHGRLQKQIDARNAFVTFQYDELGRIIRKDARTSVGQLESYGVYTYDAGADGHDVQAGELYMVEEYDGQNAILRRTRYGYDPLFRRMNLISRFISGVGEFQQRMTYNWIGQMTSTTFPSGMTLHYKYMRKGGLEKICEDSECDPESGEVYYSINPQDFNQFGALRAETYGNGVQSTYAYYPHSHRLLQKNIFREVAPEREERYFSRSYRYDEYSNITWIQDPIGMVGYSGGLHDVQYDNLDRLTGYTHQNTREQGTIQYDQRGNIVTNSAGFSNQQYQYSPEKPNRLTQIGNTQFDYDDNGNMLFDGSRQMEYDAQNKLARVFMRNQKQVFYEYDYTGARVKKVSQGIDHYGRFERKETHYLGDSLEIKNGDLLIHIFAGNQRIATRGMGPVENFLAMAGGPLMDRGFSPDGIAMASISPWTTLLFILLILMVLRGRTGAALNETFFQLHYKSTSKIIALLLATIFFIQMPTMAFAQARGIHLPQVVESDQDFLIYYHSDHLGSSSIISEGKASARHGGLTYRKGEILQRFEYTPFGQTRFVLNPTLNLDASYTGQAYDVDTGLYYYKSRFYDPKLGRFIQPDTLFAAAKNFQTYNRYSYASNNPLIYTDPTGHIAWLVPLIVGIALGAAIGAVAAAITGGNILMGALTGAISGAIFGAVGQAIQPALLAIKTPALVTLVQTASHVVAGTMSGAVNSAITKGNIGLGTIIGAASAGVGQFFGGKLVDQKFLTRLLARSFLGAATGGIVSEIYGGNFLQGAVNGAVTAAVGTLFNEAMAQLKDENKLVPNVKVYRKDIDLFGDDKYGHWWIEIDGKESYGWWPAQKVGPLDTLMGVPGELNGLTAFKGGTPTSDPHHGDGGLKNVKAYNVYSNSGAPNAEIVQGIRNFANSYSGSWSWPAGQNCHSFQNSLLQANGLTIGRVK